MSVTGAECQRRYRRRQSGEYIRPARMIRDEASKQFGRLTARWPEGIRRGRAYIWLFSCVCGVLVHADICTVRSGETQSCGCWKREAVATRSRTHGMTGTAEYIAYREARARCRNKKNPKWKYYGARGIKFKFSSFEEFLVAVGKKPDPALVLDRIDNDGHYEAGNLRWATMSQSNLNRRGYGENR